MPSLIAILGFDKGPFDKGLDQAQAKARSAGSGIESAFGGLGSKLAGLASVGAVTAAIHSTVEYASKINDLSLRLGISTDAVQQWDYALKQNGSSIDSAVGFFEKLGVNRQKALNGNDEAIASFAKLGVTLDDLKTKRLEDVAAVIAKAFESGDPQALIASLREVGGKGAGEMITAFRDGLSETLKAAPLISPEDIEALDRLGDKWSQVKAIGMATFATLLVGIGDLIVQTIDVARIALDFGVGAFKGAYDALKAGLGDLGVKDILSPTSALLRIGAQAAASSADQAGEAADKAIDRAGRNESQRRLDAVLRQAKREEHEAAFKGGEEDSTKADAKAAKAEERLAAKEQAADAKAAADALKENEKDQKEGAAFGKHHVNAQQQLGAFFGNYASAGTTLAPEMAALNVQTKSEQHLAKIVALLTKQQGEDEALGQGLYF